MFGIRVLFVMTASQCINWDTQFLSEKYFNDAGRKQVSLEDPEQPYKATSNMHCVYGGNDSSLKYVFCSSSLLWYFSTALLCRNLPHV